MTKLSKTRQMCVRLRALGVPKQQTDQIIKSFTTWTNCSGPEWTVERLKALKLEYVTRLAGKPVLAPNFRRNNDGYPAGVWSWLFKQSGKHAAFKVLNVLMMYSTLSSPSITEKQKKKFFGSMQSEDKTGLETTLKYKPTTFVYRLMPQEPFLISCTSPSKSAPSTLGKSIRADDAWGQFVFFANSVNCLTAYYRYPLVFEKVVPKPLLKVLAGSPSYHLDIPSVEAADYAVGKLGFIQEPGYKLRAVANPNAVWQAALQPLKVLILQDLKSNFFEDCTHDQEHGVLSIQGWLKQGKTCYSVDLSDATNLMPRHLQMDLLRSRYLFADEASKQRFSQLVDAFEFASQAPWYFRDEEDGKFKLAKFTRGQPLGLGPSFACFALAHNVILRGICQKYGVNPKDTYRILGDDIVISNETVHRVYRATLSNLGCVVSEAKTLESNVCAEFGGRVITANDIIPTYKWRRVVGSNFMDVAKAIGIKARGLLTPGQRLIVDLVAETPEEYGGFGWNPNGKSLTERLSSPTSKWLLSRTLDREDAILIQYRTLTSLLRGFFNQARSSGLVPYYRTSSIDQHLWAGDLGSTRSDLLEFWDNDAITDSIEAEKESTRMGIPSCDTVFLKGERGSWKRIKSPHHGWMYPVGMAEMGTPKAKIQTLSQMYSTLLQEQFGLTPKQALKKVSSAFAQEAHANTRPYFNWLNDQRQNASKERQISSSATETESSEGIAPSPKRTGLRR